MTTPLTTPTTTRADDKPYSPFMADELLTRLNEHARSCVPATTGTGEHFSELGLGELDLLLTTRSGYQDDQIGRALSLCKGLPVSPAPGVVERLKASLYVLGDSRAAGITSMFPEMVTGAQHILNELLLEFPVLMHPRLQVHVYADGNPGTCSVAHAVAMASRGRFPMAGDRGVSRERLQGWVRHASVHLGFQTHAIPLFDQTTSAVTGARPVEAAAKKARSQQWMLASVDQLFELCRSAPEERNRFVGDIVPTDPRGRWTGPGLEAFTVSFFGACGILDGVQCPAFFDVLKRAGYGENASLRRSVVDYSAGYILGGGGIGVTGDIPSRFDAVVMGMVECKLAASAVAAAEMLWRSIADRSTRQVVVAEALDVVRSVRTAGVTVTVSERDFGTAAKAEPWVHALEVHDAALAMNRVIDQVAPTPVPTSAKPMTRRRRNGL